MSQDSWDEYFRQVGPRLDQDEPFDARRYDGFEPCLLNQPEVLIAARVGARILEVLAARSGSRLLPSAPASLRRQLDRAIPEEVANLADEEARRSLRWLESRPPRPQDGAPESSGLPELDLMRSSPIEQRASVAAYALEAGLDLELEYFDDDKKIWPRRRLRPLELYSDEQGDYWLRLRSSAGADMELAVEQIRWLMPVQATDGPNFQPAPQAEVIAFPGFGRATQTQDEALDEGPGGEEE